MLQSLVLAPKSIPELHEGADGPPKAQHVPKTALAAFKFKLKQPKSVNLIWSNKGGSSPSRLSIWEVMSTHNH